MHKVKCQGSEKSLGALCKNLEFTQESEPLDDDSAGTHTLSRRQQIAVCRFRTVLEMVYLRLIARLEASRRVR